MSKTTIYKGEMLCIKSKSMVFYYTLREAMDACAAEKARGCAVVTEIVRL